MNPLLSIPRKRALAVTLSSLALATFVPWQTAPASSPANTTGAAGQAPTGATSQPRDAAAQAPGMDERRSGAAAQPLPPGADAGDLSDAVTHMTEARSIVQQMEADPAMKKLMQQAKGIYIVPDYGRAAAVVGAQGGAGVLVVKQGGKWTGPAFYNMGSISVGAQAGATAGAIALLLMNDRAVQSFGSENNFSLDANAGLSIINYSARAQATAGKGDVILWSDTEGAFAGASIAVSDIVYDDDETSALYRKQVEASEVVAGRVQAPPQAQSLLKALPS